MMVHAARRGGPGQTLCGVSLDLVITEATVTTHLLRIFTRLGVSDRTAAVTTHIGRGELR